MNKYNRISKHIICSFILILSCVLFAACSKPVEQTRLGNLETTSYVHDNNGASLTIPVDWTTISQDEKSVAFANPDQTLSFTVYCEIGGYSYYSYTELEETANNILKETLKNFEVLSKDIYKGQDNSIKLIGTGTIGDDENPAMAEVVIVSPYNAIRYYIVALTTVDEYEKSSILLNDIYESFYIGKSQDDLYKQLKAIDQEVSEIKEKQENK